MAALEAVHRDPALQPLRRRRPREREAAAPDDADVLRDHVGEGVDVLPPRHVEVALEQQVRAALLLIGAKSLEDRPADVVDGLELQPVIAEVRVVTRAAHHEPQDRHPERRRSASAASDSGRGRRTFPPLPCRAGSGPATSAATSSSRPSAPSSSGTRIEPHDRRVEDDRDGQADADLLDLRHAGRRRRSRRRATMISAALVIVLALVCQALGDGARGCRRSRCSAP